MFVNKFLRVVGIVKKKEGKPRTINIRLRTKPRRTTYTPLLQGYIFARVLIQKFVQSRRLYNVTLFRRVPRLSKKTRIEFSKQICNFFLLIFESFDIDQNKKTRYLLSKNSGVNIRSSRFVLRSYACNVAFEL